ncbi:uncharacterized protein LOC142325318 isoform X2 [Lycorma delicatula]|uniref:uncharacterized protein LOC142325318 isoform X2 n=1 Tax=Lycorma delicatula TaxID=130591 RepID=UPI003F510913
MSDFIPPLISSSPPPMPDFDDDDDDDVEFGIGSTIGDIDFPGSVNGHYDKEKKDKILEIESRRLEINGTNNSWKCEEQDSTSQDSGLCMASQSSEGMSPLPQSDDEDKSSHYNNNNLKHSSTVMFNPDDSSSKSNNSTAYNIISSNDTLPNDTGQSNIINNENNVNSEICVDSSKNNSNNESDSDSEFIWGSASNDTDDLFQQPTRIDHEIIISNSDNTSLENNIDLNTVTCDNSVSASLDNTTFHHKSVENFVTKNSIDDELSTTDSIDDSSFGCKDSKNVDNNFCDIDDSINIDNLDDNQASFRFSDENDKKGDEINKNDEYDDDEFGNFSCVTIPNCDSVLNSVVNFNNEFVTSDLPKDDSFKETESKIQKEKEDECDLEFKSTNLENSCSGSVICKLSSEVTNDDSLKSKYDDVKCQELSDSGAKFNSGDDNDDDFNEFSDFTQSSDLPVHFQQPEISLQNVESSCKTNSSQDVFEEIFPKSDDQIYSDIQTNDLEEGPVWKHLCPLENSPALAFQWSNSQAHNRLLAALSIDSRNILFGPHWNANVPRFAANLGSNPLQPIKAVEIQPVNSSSPVPPPNEEVAAVPDAHFDWVSSGLTNPLDCTHSALLDLEILSSFDNLTTADNTVGDKTANDFEKLNENCRSSNTVENLNILSSEAENIISLLPDLNFMRKTYIEILISKG